MTTQSSEPEDFTDQTLKSNSMQEAVKQAFIQDDNVLNKEYDSYKRQVENRKSKTSKKSFKCELCIKKYFKKRSDFVKHIQKHNADIVSKYTCPLCRDNFDTNKELIFHKQFFQHKDDSFLCIDCKLAFSNHCDWLVHNATHITKSLYQCEECQKYFMHKNSYTNHIYTHTAKTFHCTICSRVLSTEENLRKHITDHENVHECCECGREFLEKKALRKHMMIHTGVRPYQCLYCGKGFTSQLNQKSHMKTHSTEKPYKCDYCEKRFKEVSYKKTHNCRAVKTLSCEVCKKMFKSDVYLKQHMLLHSDVRPFPCKQCPERFVSLQSLKAHTVFRHTTEYPFTCNICDHKSKMKGDMTRHMRKVHFIFNNK